ncbi:hypothetical protein ACFX2J_014626 [Malus domestica]
MRRRAEHKDHTGQVLERSDVDMDDQEYEEDDNAGEENVAHASSSVCLFVGSSSCYTRVAHPRTEERWKIRDLPFVSTDFSISLQLRIASLHMKEIVNRAETLGFLIQLGCMIRRPCCLFLGFWCIDFEALCAQGGVA